LLDRPATEGKLNAVLAQYCGSVVPGLQYVVVNAGGTLYDYAGGLADIGHRRAMTSATTMMVYSMTKVFTAAAILQLADRATLALEDEIDRYLPDSAYVGYHITIRQLINHTSGIPNPIPLRWVHLVEEDSTYDEAAELAKVSFAHRKLNTEPGREFAYSNIGYWLLGRIVERVTGQSYAEYVRGHILQPIGLAPLDIDFVIPDVLRHANGYLAKYSVMNLMKGFVTDSRLWGEYEGNWLRIKGHYVNGPAFGGLVGTAAAFAQFLQDQLRATSIVFNDEVRRLFEGRQTDRTGRPIPMTLAWHVGTTGSDVYFFKEGGGGGFHCEMRLYPRTRIGTVVMVNSADFNSSKFLNRIDVTYAAALSQERK
jgi:D-alanyl-D-alanine carboxypeptidase